MNKTKFWNFTKRDEKTGELTLYGEISDVSWYGDEVTPVTFREDLKALGTMNRLNVYVNSPGGDVFAGFTIYNIIRRCAEEIVAHVDGMAASAASVICMAADKIVMPKNATMMIHEALAGKQYGNKHQFRKIADELDRIDGQIADIYAARCGIDKKTAADMMEAETWMSGEEAYAAGFCDEVDDLKAVACAGIEKYENLYHHMPKAVKQEPQAPAEPKQTAANGGTNQPVTDIDDNALNEQRRQLWNLRKKINGGE